MPLFVILRHDAPSGVHFDFMLESGASLRTWSLPRPPTAGKTLECLALPDHRKAYLRYEGDVSNGRGTVARWDRGVYATVRQTETEWLVALSGQKLAGVVSLCRMKKDACWRFRFDPMTRLSY